MTNYVGELIQHDTSIHLWSPFANEKWYLITSLDDYSRCILYGDLWSVESSWAHICAVNSVVSSFGCPFQYYVDRHSIFKYVATRDRNKPSFSEEDARVQWKEVLKDLNIKPTYALSPQAKGKIERPYRWLQDRIFRTCSRERVTTIEQAREVLYYELNQYNFHRIHSTTKEIPRVRLERAIENKDSLFRKFVIKPPLTQQDIFCYRFKRSIDSYNRVSLNNVKMSVANVRPDDEVELRLSPNPHSELLLVRFWRNGRFLSQSQIKPEDLPRGYTFKF